MKLPVRIIRESRLRELNDARELALKRQALLEEELRRQKSEVMVLKINCRDYVGRINELHKDADAILELGKLGAVVEFWRGSGYFCEIGIPSSALSVPCQTVKAICAQFPYRNWQCSERGTVLTLRTNDCKPSYWYHEGELLIEHIRETYDETQRATKLGAIAIAETVDNAAQKEEVE